MVTLKVTSQIALLVIGDRCPMIDRSVMVDAIGAGKCHHHRWHCVSFVQIFTQQQVVMMPGKMADQLLQRLEVQCTEAAGIPSARFR